MKYPEEEDEWERRLLEWNPPCAALSHVTRMSSLRRLRAFLNVPLLSVSFEDALSMYMAQHSHCKPADGQCTCALNTMKTTIFCYQLITPQSTRGPRHPLGRAFKRALQILIDDNDTLRSVRGPGVIEHAVRDVSPKMLQDWCLSVPNARDAVILGLYCFLPAARRDYHALVLCGEENVPDDNSNCLICNADGTYDILLRTYKTAHVYNNTKSKIGPELQALIDEHLETSNNAKYLFEYVDKHGRIAPSKAEFIDAQLKKILSPLFAARGHDVNCNVSLLRKIWRTHTNDDPFLARKMMHSDNVAERFYNLSA